MQKPTVKKKISNMKKIIIATSAILFGITSITAQDIPQRNADHPKMMHKEHSKKGGHMDMKALNLTDTQKQQLKTNREDFRKKMDDLKKLDNITVKEQRTRMEAIKAEQKKKFEMVLTQEQKDKMKTLRTEGMEKHKKMMKERGAMLKERLSLTDEQSAKLEKSRTASMERMKAIRENQSLTDEQKKEQVKELHKKQKEELKSVLTEEQLKKLKEAPHHRKGQHPKGEKPTPAHKTV
jgi:Spy/CpxP family protein refolding chaperone